jgi:hypothetical protein
VLGPVDEDLAAELVATGATESELSEAYAWLFSDEALINEDGTFRQGGSRN